MEGEGSQNAHLIKHPELSEAVYVAEQKGREAVAMRTKVHKAMAIKEKERRDHELRALAEKARAERTESKQERGDDKLQQRQKVREERRRERERERRLENKDAKKKSKITRDRDRDISEKVALGTAFTKKGQVMYDQRLFNQDKGMDSGFAVDDQYNLYDKGLFQAQNTLLSTLYRPTKDAGSEMYGGADEQLEKIRKTERFKPHKAFPGTKGSARDRPVEFESEEGDPFGLDQFLTELKKSKKTDKGSFFYDLCFF